MSVRVCVRKYTNRNTMENDVIRLAGELSVAVEVIMDPNVSQQARMDAYIACEK